MNLSDRLSVSYYETVLPINEHHKVYLVRHRETGRLCVKKILDIYSADVYVLRAAFTSLPSMTYSVR